MARGRERQKGLECSRCGEGAGEGEAPRGEEALGNQKFGDEVVSQEAAARMSAAQRTIHEEKQTTRRNDNGFLRRHRRRERIYMMTYGRFFASYTLMHTTGDVGNAKL